LESADASSFKNESCTSDHFGSFINNFDISFEDEDSLEVSDIRISKVELLSPIPLFTADTESSPVKQMIVRRQKALYTCTSISSVIPRMKVDLSGATQEKIGS